MAGFRIEGSTSSNVVEVDTSHNLMVNLPKDTDITGYAIMMSENDPGAVTGTPYVFSPETTEDYRLRVQQETLLLSETFNYTTQDFGKWFHYAQDVAIITYSGGDVQLNLSASNANNGAMIKSCRTFPIFGTASTYMTFTSNYTQIPGGFNTMEIGFGIPASVVGGLTDGVCFRWTAGGILQGVFNYNGSETFTSNFSLPESNTNHTYIIALTQRECQFWIDDILQETLWVPPTLGQATSQASLPVFARSYNLATPSTYIQVIKISNMTVTLGGLGHTKTWADVMAGAGNNCAQSYAGLTSSYTSNLANSVGINTASLSNTVPSYYHLGGDFIIPSTVGSPTDYALFAFKNPGSSVAITAKTLIVTGLVINTYNNVAAVTTSPTVLNWQLGFGSTQLSLLTTDTSVTTDKGPRKIPLGTQSFIVGSAIGLTAPDIIRDFRTPIVVNQGEHLHIIVRITNGAATANETFCGSVFINGYWE